MLPSDPSYLRAEQGPPRFEAPRRYCSVCGFTSTCVGSVLGLSVALDTETDKHVCFAPRRYTCPRCGMRYCGVRCAAVHTETRCLKFTVF